MRLVPRCSQLYRLFNKGGHAARDQTRRTLTRVTFAILLTATFAKGNAQDSQTQPTPFSVWLDLQHPKLRSPSWPVWLESVEHHSHLAADQRTMAITIRIRFRRFASINNTLLLRLHFVDAAGASPVVTAWSDTALRPFDSGPLGRQLGLPTFETLTIPMQAVDYIDIDESGNGTNLTGVFLSSLGAPKGRSAVDFELENPVADPFGAPAPATPKPADIDLYGRVKASLLNDTVILSEETGRSTVVEFEIESIPLLGLISFEILYLDPLSPPHLLLNNQPLGTAEAALPDLADPAYRGVARPLQPDMEFHYAGWTRCQKVIAASALRQGLNRLVLQSGSTSEAVALRSIELQLKYNSSSFDYQLAPLPRR